MQYPKSLLRRRFPPLLVAAAILVAGGDVLFWQHGLYGGQTGFYLAALLLPAIVMRPAIWRDRRSWIAATASMLYAAAYVLEPGQLTWTMFWVAAGMMVLLPATGRFDDGWRWFQRLLSHGLRSTVAPMLDARRIAKTRRRTPTRSISLRRGMRALALPLTGSLVILALFASANPVLAQALSTLTAFHLSALSIVRFLFWMLLFAMAWSLLHPRPKHPLLKTFDGSGDLDLPGVSVRSVSLSLILFNLLFALQNVMDVCYLSGLLPMPEGISLAEYAHRGAYPLIATALLAALFVLIVLRPGSTIAGKRSIRAMLILWIGQNTFLVGSSIVRTIDYIEAYSLTELRIAALAWMVLVASGLVFICWRMLRGKSAGWLININLASAGLVLTAFCFLDTGAIVANWNVRHSREVGGRGAALDLCYLNSLGGSALDALIILEGRLELHPAFRDRVQSVRSGVMDRLASQITDGGWTWRGQQQLERGKALLASMPARPALRPALRNCDGSLYVPPRESDQAISPAPANAAAVAPAVEQTPATGVQKVAPGPRAPKVTAPASTLTERSGR